MKVTNWNNKEWDIKLDEGEPSKYIEDLIAPLEYHRKWTHKTEKYLSFDNKPWAIEKYQLTYNIKRRENEDIDELDFIMYLVDKAVDYINNLETVLSSDTEEEQPNDKEDIF